MGDVLGHRFRLDKLIRADRSCAYLAATAKDGAPVDVQVLLAMDDGADAVRIRFLAEARRVAALSEGQAGSGIVRVLHVGMTGGGYPFVVREARTGETLAALLERLGSLPTENAVDVTLALAETLAAAHQHGLVHGELSPRTVSLVYSEEDGPRDVKLDELGTARALASLPLDPRMRLAFGSTAPELLQSERDADERSDLWSLGMLLYRMLAGGTPFNAAGSPSTLDVSAALDEPALLAGVPDTLSDIVDSCIARDPAARPRSMKLLATKLAPFGWRSVEKVEDLTTDQEIAANAEAKRAIDPDATPVGGLPSIAPLSFSIVPPPPPGAALPLRTPMTAIRPVAVTPRRSSGRMVAAACVTVGIVIGAVSTHLSSSAPEPDAAAAGPAATVTPVAATSIPDERGAATDAGLASAPRASHPSPVDTTAPSALLAPTAPPVVPSPVEAKATKAPPAPSPVSPKSNDDDLRRFLDDRR